MAAANVAGFDSAIYGLPEKQAPLLFELPDYQALISTTNLCRFVSGRYAPAKEWGAVWEQIIEFVLPGTQYDDFSWTPEVGPTYSKEETLPENFQRESLLRGVEWYKNARMLIPGSYAAPLGQLVDSGVQRLALTSSNFPVGI